jgi:DNA-binding response OmpR family regulator
LTKVGLGYRKLLLQGRLAYTKLTEAVRRAGRQAGGLAREGGHLLNSERAASALTRKRQRDCWYQQAYLNADRLAQLGREYRPCWSVMTGLDWMRLLIVEDNIELSQLVAGGLLAAGYEADIVSSAGEARDAVRSVKYAAMILDLGLPDGDGLSVLVELRRRMDPLPVLVLTARGGLQDRLNGLRSGADDYLAKPFALEELVARLEAILRRPGQLLGSSLNLANLVYDTESRQIFIDGVPRVFTARETSVLEILLRRHGRVVPKKNVEDHIFGLAGDVASNAVEVYVSRLRKQLAEHGAKILIHTIRGVGYLMAEDK